MAGVSHEILKVDKGGELFLPQNCGIVILLSFPIPFCHLPKASKYLKSYNGIAFRVIPVTTVYIGAPSKINLFWLLV